MATNGLNEFENQKFIESTSTPGVKGVAVVNPDGSNIGGGEGGSAAYSDASNVDKKGLVDADRHVQVDVLTMPGVTVDTTGLATSAKQDTLDTSINTLLKPASTLAAVTSITNVVHVDDNGGALTVDGTVAVTNAGITTIAGAVSGTEMQVDVLTMPTTTVQATNLDIRDLSSASDSVTVTGTVAVTNSDITSIKTAVEVIDNAISGSEMQVDIVGALPAGTNAIGKLLPSDVDVTTNTNHADKYYTNAGAVTDGIVWSPAAGKRWHITTLYINVSAAATVTIEDDLAGGDVVRWKGELAANSGVILTYTVEHPFASGEDAADLIITTTAGNVYVQAVGYEI